MKKIIINSKKRGIKEVLVDDEDFDFLNKYKWSLAGHDQYYYAVGWVNSRSIRMHRLIMKEDNKSVLIDHKDHNGLNNQKINLRRATYSQNGMNRRVKSTSLSQYLGLGWCKRRKRWIASITQNGKPTFLGWFKDEKEAAIEYDKAAKAMFGEFANLNFK